MEYWVHRPVQSFVGSDKGEFNADVECAIAPSAFSIFLTVSSLLICLIESKSVLLILSTYWYLCQNLKIGLQPFFIYFNQGNLDIFDIDDVAVIKVQSMMSAKPT